MTLSLIRNSGIVLLFFITIFITSNVHAKKYPEGYPKCWQDPENPVKALDKDFKKIDLSKPNLGQDPELFLPVNSKVGHKFILVDFTSPWKKPQIDWIEDRIFGFSNINLYILNLYFSLTFHLFHLNQLTINNSHLTISQFTFPSHISFSIYKVVFIFTD